MSTETLVPLRDIERAFHRMLGSEDGKPRNGSAVMEWRKLVETLSEMAPAEGTATFVPVSLSTLDISAPAPLLLDRLDPAEHTVMYGPGGVGKGTLAASWITRLTAEGYQVLILDYEDHGGEWGRRIEGLGGSRESVAWIAPYRLGLGDITQSAPAIRDLLAQQRKPYLVIDSAAMAVSGDPSDAETARAYFAALQVIGAPSLTLAHVTKLHDPRYPFGSAFWHNLARLTWSLIEKGNEVLLTCRKANNYRKPSAAVVETVWHNDVLREVHERKAVVVLTDRIIEALELGRPLSPSGIAEVLNDGVRKDEHTSPDTIRNALNRELRRGASSRVTVADGQWSIRAGG